MSAASRTRLASWAVYFLLLLLILLPLVSCSSSAPSPNSAVPSTRSAVSSTLLAPTPVSAAQVSSDPALGVAVLFERAHCGWDWHESQRAYLAGQQKLATAAYGAQLAAAADPTSWQQGVLDEKQTVTCVVERRRPLCRRAHHRDRGVRADDGEQRDHLDAGHLRRWPAHRVLAGAPCRRPLAGRRQLRGRLT